MSEELAIDNLRLKELVAVAWANKPVFDEFLEFLKAKGYKNTMEFANELDERKGHSVIIDYLRLNSPIQLFDGVFEPYEQGTARFYLLAWLFRDAPAQRLKPMIATMAGDSTIARQATLLNRLRIYVAPLFPHAVQWEWFAFIEVLVARLEGSRRAKKGALFERLVRRSFQSVLDKNKIPLTVHETQISLNDETYDVSIKSKKQTLLIPVKTRETMGGGHALLFTRDIHKAITVANDAGFKCLPIVIAESWGGDLKGLKCDFFIHIPVNPNKVDVIEPILRNKIEDLLPQILALLI